MSTLKHLDIALIDLRDRLTKELQFSHDAETEINLAIEVVTEGLSRLDRAIKKVFAERNRALETALGMAPLAPPADEAKEPEALDATVISAKRKAA